MTKATCSFDGCDRVVHARDICKAHSRQRLKGKPLTPLTIVRPHSVDPTQWFLSWFDESGGPDSCHEWKRCRDKDGYGVYRLARAHIMKWELANGPVPDGLLVLHACDNAACGNVRHLFLGTQTDNVADMTAKGRQARGTRHGMVRLTESQVREIRRLKAEEGLGPRLISRRLGLNERGIKHILDGDSWAWLE